MTLASKRLRSLGILDRIVRLLGSPKLIYLQAPKYNQFLKLNGSVIIHDIGDSWVGAGANIGAGTITCNYDGFFKFRTEIGEGAFIGSNTALVAPVKIGAGAITGAGSTISKDVPDNALSITRAPQDDRPGWAMKYRLRKQAEKDAANAGKKKKAG